MLSVVKLHHPSPPAVPHWAAWEHCRRQSLTGCWCKVQTPATQSIPSWSPFSTLSNRATWKARSALPWASSFVTNKLFYFLLVCVWHHHFWDTNKILIWFHPDFAECCQDPAETDRLLLWCNRCMDTYKSSLVFIVCRPPWIFNFITDYLETCDRLF